jgi:uncharacterized phiE125 gp8 family phage protein
MTAVLLVPPTGEPVSLDEAKAWLRLDSADDDALVTALIPAARAVVEGATRRPLLTQTWRLALDAWPIPRSGDPFLDDALIGPSIVPLPLAPIASVAAIRIFSAGGLPQALDVATWQLVGAPETACVLFNTSPPAPGRAVKGVEIDIVTGYGASSDVPQPLRQAILMLIARWYDNRGDTEALTQVLPTSVAALIAPFRRARLA